ncbi:ubiquitin carboxyl-terminal hydrolase 24 [Iris pallida]|uniref:Ubiquitin carboxyl-terminal hydrolase n=1 Tax=Iris pallida TaxID=29817 RepID=A0AAX6DIW7_IRIPA|nr:ubiquitin carboxyl-terminal hydrolase 24 [Iris pallida]
MDDQKVFIFGSFTEDESRLFQNKSTVKDHAPPLENLGFKLGDPLQFGSLDASSLDAIGGFGAEPKQIPSSNSRNTQESNPITQEKGNQNVPVNYDLVKDTEAQENGVPNDCFNIIDHTGIRKYSLDTNSVPVSGNDDIKSELTSPKVTDDGSETSSNISFLSDTHAVNHTMDMNKKVNGKAPLVPRLLPRGLINLGNLCFLNATLQALLSCSPFVQLLQILANQNVPKTGYPILQAFIEFISDFGVPDDPRAKKQEKGVLETGKPFSPLMFDPVLKLFTPDIPISLSGRPRQEDAQEFLSFVLDRMHDELLKLEGNLSNSNGGRLPLVSSSEDDGWETVGPKNKSAVTRTQSFVPSELSAIFGGQLRSVVKARGSKASATVQPFLLLHLDILPEDVRTIEDALHLFSASETLEGYRASVGKAGVVSASKSVQIQTLSKVLILHLMRFSYGSRGSLKLHKPVHFPLELVLARDLLVTPPSEGKRKYELVATIRHHGQDPSKGHYTADARSSGGQWLRYDDSAVVPVGTSKVLHDQAYVLFYKLV